MYFCCSKPSDLWLSVRLQDETGSPTTVFPKALWQSGCCRLCEVQSGPLCPGGMEEGQEGSWFYVSVVIHCWDTVSPLLMNVPQDIGGHKSVAV